MTMSLIETTFLLMENSILTVDSYTQQNRGAFKIAGCQICSSKLYEVVRDKLSWYGISVIEASVTLLSTRD